MFLVGLFILQSASQLAINEVSESEMIDDVQLIERVHFELRDGVFNEAKGTYQFDNFIEQRTISAETIIGTFDEFGFELSRPILSLIHI